MGQVQPLDWLPPHLVERGLIKSTGYGIVGGTPQTPGTIFARGDVVRGPAMVVDALGDGKRAAHNIDAVLRGQAPASGAPVAVMPYARPNASYFIHATRA